MAPLSSFSLLAFSSSFLLKLADMEKGPKLAFTFALISFIISALAFSMDLALNFTLRTMTKASVYRGSIPPPFSSETTPLLHCHFSLVNTDQSTSGRLTITFLTSMVISSESSEDIAFRLLFL